jgi:hypothetical protein
MVDSLMTQGRRGEFLIRDKASVPGAMALTVKEADGSFLTFLVEFAPHCESWTIMGTTEYFETLNDLVAWCVRGACSTVASCPRSACYVVMVVVWYWYWWW